MMFKRKYSTTVKQRREERRAMVILPSSRFARMWRLVLICAVLFTAIIAPFELAFVWWITPRWVDATVVAVDMLFWADMVLSFFIAPVVRGEANIRMRDRSLIYLRTWFLFDLLTNFPWDVLTSGGAAGKLLKLPKIFRMFRLLRVFRDGAHYFGVACSIIALLLAAHYTACFWAHALGRDGHGCDAGDDPQDHPGCSTVADAYAEIVLAGMVMISGASSWEHFAAAPAEGRDAGAAYVWSGVPAEELPTAAAVATSICLVALFFGNIARSLGAQASHQRIRHKRCENIRRTEEYLGLDKRVGKRLQKHFQYFLACGVEVCRDVLEDWCLTRDLGCTLAHAFYGNFLKRVPLFQVCDQTVLKQICARATVEIVAEDDIIISAGERESEFYFLIAGQVRVTAPTEGHLIRTLVEGSFFGEIGLLFPNTCRTANVIASTPAVLLSIAHENLETICSSELLDAFKSVGFERLQSQRHAGLHGDKHAKPKVHRRSIDSLHTSRGRFQKPRTTTTKKEFRFMKKPPPPRPEAADGIDSFNRIFEMRCEELQHRLGKVLADVQEVRSLASMRVR